VPLTYPAHQAPAIALKIVRPRWFDGTALCVGAALPDLAYPFGSWLAWQSHKAMGIAVWAVPVAVAICALLRRRAAAGIFAHLPDAGPLRLRSLRVIGTRRPPLLITVWSAALGAGSHIVIDAFTHRGWWGARLLGLSEWPGEYVVPDILQAVGHVVGTLAALLLLIHIARRGLLERWYGAPAVEAARRVDVTGRVRFWSTFGLVFAVPVLVVLMVGRDPVFVGVAATVAGLLVAGWLGGEALGTGTQGESPSRRVPSSTTSTSGRLPSGGG